MADKHNPNQDHNKSHGSNNPNESDKQKWKNPQHQQEKRSEQRTPGSDKQDWKKNDHKK